MNANQPFGFSRRINRRTIAIFSCFSLIATLGWLAFSPTPHDEPVAENRPRTLSSPSEVGVTQPSVAVATPAPAATHAAVDPHEETPACSAGCSSHAHPIADPAAQAAPPSKRAWDYDFLKKLTTAAVGNPIRFELTDGVFAAGTIQHMERVRGELIMVTGKLSTPEAGRFFFQKQTLPGKQGDFAGLVEFPTSKTAWRIEPSGPGGKSELVKRRLDEVICILPPRSAAALAEEAPEPEMAPLDPSDVSDYVPGYNNGIISLQSLPGAAGVLYIDYRGGYTPTWGGITYEKPYVANPQIKEVWARVSEDFMPFNINVTTDVRVFDAAAENSRMRCIVTPTDTARPGAAGVSNLNAWNWTGDIPNWAFYTSGYRAAEVISHEVGHALGLKHDGTTTNEYFSGHGTGAVSWAPIMGTAYSRARTQWSKGEYANAKRTEDDLAIITNNNSVDYRPDDTGNTLATARYLEVNADGTVFAEGVIETTGETDAFRFTTTGGAVSLNANPILYWANLAIKAELADSTDTVIATSNIQTQVNASINTTLPAGTYTFRITGAGRNDPVTNGFSDYASLGYYSISGSVTNGLPRTHFNVAENSPNGTSVGTVTTTNPNHDPLVYTIVSGNTNNTFTLNNSGVLTVTNSAALNYEALELGTQLTVQYELFVNITNATNPALSETNRRVVVQVLDVNDAPSVTGDAVTILEHSAIGTNVLMASATDPDQYDYVTSYSITGGNTGNAFAINSSTGQITVASDIDVTANTVFNLTVTVTDLRTPVLTGSVVIPVTVANIAAGYTPGRILRSYFENITGNAVLDLTSNAKFPNSPDSEQYLAAFDGLTHGDNFGSTIRGYLIPPVTGTYQFWIASDASSELFLSTDSSPANATAIASATSETGQYAWTTNASQQSVPKTLTAGQPYYIEARHKEGTGDDHVAVAWTGPGITTNQVIPGLYLAPYYQNYPPKPVAATFTIRENAVPGQAVGTVTTADVNTHETFTYAITGGNTGGVFAINAATGQLSVAQPGLLNVLATPSYTLTIQSTDNGTPALSGSGTVTVNVIAATLIYETQILQEIWTRIAGTLVIHLTNIADYPYQPTLRRPLTSFDMGQGYDLSYGSRIRAKFIAPTTDSYKFYISSDDSSSLLFSANENGSGATQIAYVSGYTPYQNWTTYASQTSEAQSLTAGQVVYLETLHKQSSGDDHVCVAYTNSILTTPTVIPGSMLRPFDINGAPVFSPTSYSYNVTAATATPGMVLGTVTATDPNSEPLVYGILSGNAQGAFAINSATGQITVANPAGLSQGTVTLQIAAQDGGMGGIYPLGTATATVVINVTASNTAPAWVSNPVVKPGAAEDVAYSETLDGSASDVNGGALTFSKVSGPSWLAVAANGALTGTPGISTGGLNSFVVRVTDSLGIFADATLQITVTGINHPPVFTTNPMALTAIFNQPVSGAIAATATDPDAGETLTFSKVTGPAWLNVAANGTLTGTPAFKNMGLNVFTVRVTDVGGLTADATLNVTVSWPPASHASIIENSSNSISGGTGLTVSSTDLVNQGQPTLLNYTSSKTPQFGAGTVNNGVAALNTTAAAFYWNGGGLLPTTLVFNLDVSTNTLGYDITRIDSFAGWETGGTQTYGNQKFTVEYSVVGNAGFSPIGAVDYSPFTSTTSNNPAYSRSKITNSYGVLASGVDAIRFVYSVPTISGGVNGGLVLQEIDVQGVPTTDLSNGTWLSTAAGPFNWGDSANWTDGFLASGADGTAYFTPNITANQVCNLEAPRTIGNITFTDFATSSHDLTISGSNTLTLDRSSGVPVVNVTQADRMLTISSIVAGSDGLEKTGAGKLTLSGNNTYDGTTTVSAGTLIINGNQSTTTGAVSVASNATLGGTGTIGGNTTIAADGKLEFNISTPAASHDQLDLASGKTLTFSGASSLTITSTSGAAPGDYVLLTAPGGITGSAPTTLNLPAGWVATTSISGDGTSLLLNITSVAFTIAFDSAGGSAVSAITQAYGTAVTAPTNPTRTGYTFTGWSPEVPATMPDSNTTCVAQWAINGYTITFDSAGGSAVTAIAQPTDTAVIAPPNPTRSGYTFTGWSPTVPATMPASNVTCVAQWAVNGYTITFDSAGGSSVAPITRDFGTAVTAPAYPARTGYTFMGWSPAVPATMPASNIFCVAQWTVNSYIVTFQKQGGTGGSDSVLATYGSAMPPATAPTGTNEIFAGYYPNADGTGTQYYTGAMASATNWNIAAATTLYAKWVSFTDGTWLPTTTGPFNWGNSANWTNGFIASGVDKTASFTPNITASQVANLDIPRTIGNITFTDSTTSSHNLTISGANTLTLDRSSGVPAIDVTQADRTLTISSVVAGSDGLQKAGLGTLTLSGANTYTATTTISAGTLKLEGTSGGFYNTTTATRNYIISQDAVLNLHNTRVPYGTANLSGTGTLRISGSSGLGADNSGRVVNMNLNAGAVIDIQSGSYLTNGGWQAFTWTGNMATLNVNGLLSLVDGKTVIADALTGSGTIASTGTSNSYGGLNFTLGAANGSGTFTGSITASGARQMNLIKNGTGTQTFSGSTTWKGISTINGGTVQYAKTSSLYAGVTTDWVKTKIIVNTGGTVAFNVGGTDEFTTENVTTLLTGLGGTVNNNGLRLGSTIAFDTTNTSGGTFTIADTIADTTNTGGGAVGLEKLGTNTLVLSGPNSYTGETTVSAGTLLINGNQSTATGAVSVAADATLGGTGTLGGSTTIAADGKLEFNISTPAASHDQFDLTSGKTLTFSGAYSLTITSNTGAAPGEYVLLTAPGGIIGSAPTTLNLPAGWVATSSIYGDGTSLLLNITSVDFTIAFDSAGGSAVSAITQAYGTAVTAPVAPTRTGYTFTGWSPEVPATMPDSNTTCVAQWAINGYTITFDSAGGSPVTAITQDFGTAVSAPPNPTKAGYNFAGWSPALPATIPASNTTCVAQWTPTYTITFDSAGGSPVTAITQIYGTAVSPPANTTRTGYTFTGWSPAVPATMPNSNTTCVAQWTVNIYTITFNSSGGTAFSAITQNFGTTVTAPPDPTKAGHTFAGWSPVIPSTMPAANTTCIAQWTANSYTITFDSAGGSAVTAITQPTGAVVTPPANPTKTRYTFTGWSPAVPATMPASNTTCVAQWTPVAVDGTWLPTTAGPFNWGESANWTGGNVSYGIDRTASFIPDITADQVANLDVPRTIGNITFTDSTTSSHNLTISGPNILTLDLTSGIPDVNVTQADRTLTISSVVAGSDGFDKKGPGKLILSGKNTYTGGVIIYEGTLSIDSNACLGAETTGAQLGMSANTTLQATATFGLYNGTPGTNNRPIGLGGGSQNWFDVTDANTLTIAGVINGTGTVIKSGTGTLKLMAQNYHTGAGGTIVNTGTLELSELGGSDDTGVIRGILTINTGATVNATTFNALGWAAGKKVNTLHINGGLFNNTGGDQGWGLTVNLTGGELRSNGGTSSTSASQKFSAGGGWAVNSLASANPSTISGRIHLRESNASNLLTFTVADGTAATDLLVSAAITESAAGYGIAKNGVGKMTLQGDNSYTGVTNVTAGTLVINGNQSTAIGAVSVAANAALGGTGTLGGSTTIASGGKLEFDISTPAGSHNPLDFVAGKGLTFSGASTLTITSTSGAEPGIYTLVTGGNNIGGVAPATLNLPAGWSATVSISGNSLLLNVSVTQFDTTVPTLVSITDNQGGASVPANTTVNYTVAFSEDMDAATFSAADFGNAGTATASIAAITETAPGVFSVAVTPTSDGTLQLQVPAGATLTDVAGNSLVTVSAIVDDTTITVTAAVPDTTPPTPNPMTFATAPYATGTTSITMAATPATDASGIEYFFDETSGNPGGTDSGWQSSASYVDTGLTSGTQYTYTVTARDLSANQNTTAASAAASATTNTITIATQSSLGTVFSSTSWAGSLSNSDLINNGQATLAGATVTTSSFPGTGINDGVSTPGSGNTFFALADFSQPGGTAVATYNLNTTINLLGYDITSIQSIMGWHDTTSRAQANQTYTVEVSTVGSATYTNLATVSYKPFSDIAGGNHESRVVLTGNTTGVLASGVDSIRFTFFNPLSATTGVSNGTGSIEGTLVREIDVQGIPTTALTNGTWISTAAGPFNWGDTANWTGGIVATGADKTASFTPNITADQVVNLNTARTIGNILFTDNSTSSNNLTISGANTLTLDRTSGVPAVDVTQADRTLTISSVVAGTNGLEKSGSGKLTLSGANTYTGATTISGGTLLINGNQSTATGAVSFAANATLGGTGTLGGSTTIAADGKLEFNLSTPAASHDKLELAATRSLTFSGASVLTITITSGATPGTYILLTAPGGITGSAPATVNLPSGWAATASISGNDLVLNVTAGSIGPLANFLITGIPAQVLVGAPITGITLTAKDASNQTVTSFTGTVTYSGTAGITGTSASFTNGVLTGVSITPAVAGAGQTFMVTDGTGKSGTATFTVQTPFEYHYENWASTNGLVGTDALHSANPDGDTLNNLQEFAFGTDPMVSTGDPITYLPGGDVTTAGPPRAANLLVGGGVDFRAVFGRRKNHQALGLTYTVEFSAGLDVWVPSTTIPTVLTGANSAGQIEAVSVPYPMFIPTTSGYKKPTFFRVGVSGN